MGSNAEEFTPQDDEITVFVTGFGVSVTLSAIPAIACHVARSAVVTVLVVLGTEAQ
jgi:hypothetical protein